jgi:hypothetical protein
MIEIVLVLMAASLFAWGVLRAVNRGDAATGSWTTYVMSGLVVLAGSNIALRSRKIAVAALVISVLFLLLALAAALLSRAGGDFHPVAAVIRSIVFLALLGLTAWIQLHSTRQPDDTGQQSGPANGSDPLRSETNL